MGYVISIDHLKTFLIDSVQHFKCLLPKYSKESIEYANLQLQITEAELFLYFLNQPQVPLSDLSRN